MSEQGIKYQKVLDKMTGIILEAEQNMEIPVGLSFVLSPEGCKIVQEGWIDENGQWRRDDIFRIQYEDSVTKRTTVKVITG